ncbi:MAG: ATP-binding protein [Pseudomonadota bacterium]
MNTFDREQTKQAPPLKRSDELRATLLAVWPSLAVAFGVCAAFVVWGGVPLWAGGLGFAALAFVLTRRTARERQATVATSQALRTRRERTSPAGVAGKRAWRTMVDAMPDPAIVLDDQGTLLHANRHAIVLLRSVALDQHISLTSRNPQLLELIDQVQARGRAEPIQFQDRVPMERRLQATATAVEQSDARQQGPSILVTFRDLTEQDRLAQMRADFIANASHELRTPLASLRMFIETLQTTARNDPAARERFLVTMSEQALRMTRLIDDLLSLSRVEMRVHLPPRERVDLNEVLRAVMETLEPLAQASDVTLDFQGFDGAAVVRGEREELQQVFQNLVLNAIKYGGDGKTVWISCAREKQEGALPVQLLVNVRDEGPGIAEEHIPRLTERFYRISVASSREKGGTGLGLAIVKNIMMRHEGRITVASQWGEGSNFTITLNELPR